MPSTPRHLGVAVLVLATVSGATAALQQPVVSSNAVADAQSDTYDISVPGSIDIPQREVTVEGTTYQVDAIAYDFGVLYRTGFESLTLGISARNFAPEVTFQQQSDEVPLALQVGLSMDVTDLAPVSEMHDLVVTVDALNPRDYSEQIRVGGEYTFLGTLSLRAGYAFPNDAQGVSLGAGLQQEIGGITIGGDYAYTDFGIFNDFNRVHHLALHLAF